MGQVIGANYAWCLVIVVIFIGFGGEKRYEDALKPSFGLAMQATRETIFMVKEGFSPCSTAVLKLYCKSYWVL